MRPEKPNRKSTGTKPSNVIPFPRERIPYPKLKEGLCNPSGECEVVAKYGELDAQDDKIEE